MIKTLLVPIAGSDSDWAVLTTAQLIAKPLAAHIGFYHVRLSAGEAAARAPHVDFCVGPALPKALAQLELQEHQLSAAAADHVKSFCAEQGIAIAQTPATAGSVTAAWLEEKDRASGRLMAHARHSDLIILGRPRHDDYMPKLLVEDILVGSGRPIVIAPDSPRSAASLKTIVVGWKDTPESARALGAAYPLLEAAEKVILLHVADAGSSASSALRELARQLKWHGISAETRDIDAGSGPLPARLAEAAGQVDADLLVIGAFGHSRLRELVFGGVTQSFLDHGDLPVFMMS